MGPDHLKKGFVLKDSINDTRSLRQTRLRGLECFTDVG